MVHSLTGSGKTFGISALSDVARDLEEYLTQLAETKAALNEDQRNHVEHAITQLRQASSQRDDVPQVPIPTN
jgi:chemotaxis protein histidine kinase CheA